MNEQPKQQGCGFGCGGIAFIIAVFVCFAVGLHAPDNMQTWVGFLLPITFLVGAIGFLLLAVWVWLTRRGRNRGA